MTAQPGGRPRLRPEVSTTPTEDGVRLRLGDRWCDIATGDAERAAAERFLAGLRTGGRDLAALAASFPAPAEELDQLLRELDDLGMVEESPLEPGRGYTGSGAYAEVKRFADTLRAGAPSRFYQALVEERVTAAQVVGYAVEYWHIVHLCPRVLAPALAIDHDVDAWRLLAGFYQLERNHDRMLEKSLAAVGIGRDELLLTQPLSATFGIMAALGVHAYQFPLAMKACLFVMEEPEVELLEALVAASRRLGLPAAFLRPLVEHSDVNEGEDHDVISLDLLARVPYVSAEELTECKKAAGDLLGQLVRLDGQILDWYGVPDPGRADGVRLRDERLADLLVS